MVGRAKNVLQIYITLAHPGHLGDGGLVLVVIMIDDDGDDDPGHFGGGGVVVFAWPTDCFDSHQSSSPQLGLADLPFA